MGLVLFDRRPAGYTLTPAGETLRTRARHIEGAVRQFQDEAASQQRDISGIVRLTTSEILAVTLLPPSGLAITALPEDGEVRRTLLRAPLRPARASARPGSVRTLGFASRSLVAAPAYPAQFGA